MKGSDHILDSKTFFVQKSGDRLKVDKFYRGFEIFLIVYILVELYIFFFTSYSSNPRFITPFVILMATSFSFNWSMRLGWNQRKERQMRYELKEDKIEVYFRKKLLAKILYEDIIYYSHLPKPIEFTIGNPGRYGGIYYYLEGGDSKDYPTLFLYGTSIKEGVLIKRKFDWVLLTPENKDQFINQLQSFSGIPIRSNA